MKKKLSALLLAVTLMLALVLPAGCTNGGGAIDPNALVIMGKRTDMEKSYMQKIFKRYESETGKKLRIVDPEDDKFEAEAARIFVDGEGETPDIFFHFNNDDLNRLNVSANFEVLDDESWLDELMPGAKNYCTSPDGHLLGLPFWESSVSGCYYNKKILAAFDHVFTQDGFDSTCRMLKRNGITPICWPANGCSWMYQFGLDPVFADEPNGPQLLADLNAGKIDYADIPAARKMVTWVMDAADKGWFGSDYLSVGWDEISGKLSSGEAAMVFIWDTWFDTDFKPGKYTKDDFALMPVFMGTAENGTYEGGNLNMMMLCKGGAHKDEAKEFIEFCATAEHYNYAFDGVSTVSVFKGQTTNKVSQMVTDSMESVREKERASTAAAKIAGYSADDVAAAFHKLFTGEVDIDGCIALMDASRLAKKAG